MKVILSSERDAFYARRVKGNYAERVDVQVMVLPMALIVAIVSVVVLTVCLAVVL